MGRRWVAVLALACASMASGSLASGCATSATPEPELPPPTDADPIPYTPPPTEGAEAGAPPVGLAMSGGFVEAQSVGLRFLEALLAAERATLERLLGDRMALTQPQLTAATRDRDAVLSVALHPARRRVLDPSMTLDALIEVDGITAAGLDDERDGADRLPQGLEGGDVVITIPLTAIGRRVFPMLLPGWRREGKIIVRGGTDPRIVGI